MSALLATVVDGRALLETVIASVIAGVGVTIVFSLAILGAALFGDARRDGRVGAAVGAATLAILALAASAAVIVFGIFVMTSK
jgi:CHASE2 domain-containing sensor protein